MSNIPPKKLRDLFQLSRPQKKEEVEADKGGGTPRVVGKQKEKEGKINKSIGGRSKEVEDTGKKGAQVTERMPDLPLEIINFIGQNTDVATAVAISEASKALNKLAKETDLKKLEQFSQDHKLGFKERMAVFILQIAAQTGSVPSFEEIRKTTVIDSALSHEEALKQLDELEANYKEIQEAYKNLMEEVTSFGVVDVGLPMIVINGIGNISSLVLFYALGVPVLDILKASMPVFLVGSIILTTSDIYKSNARIILTSIMDLLTQRLGLS